MGGELLDIACDRIMRLDRPAYIKNSELRFVAVNAAFARLFGRCPDDFNGRRTENVAEICDKRELTDCERRALVFGREESVVFAGNSRFEDQIVSVERFMPGDGRIFVLGLFSPAAQQEPAGPSGALVPEWLAAGTHPMAAKLATPMEATVFEALDMVEVAVGMFNSDGRLIYFNSAFNAFYKDHCGPLDLGISYEALMEKVYDYAAIEYGKPLTDRLGTRKDWVRGRLENIAKPFHDTCEQACDGRWLRCISRRLDNGCAIVLRIDVTAEKKQEMELRCRIDEAKLFRSVLEEMPVATFVRDDQHRLLFVNDAYSTLVGAPRDTLLGQNEVDVFGSAGVDFKAINGEVLVSGTMVERDDLMPKRDGSIVPVITRLARIETGERQFIVGSMTDISMLKAREAQLDDARQEAENLHRDLRGLLDSMPVGILILDANLTVEFVNPPFYDIWDWPKDKRLAGMPFRDYVRVLYDRGWCAGYGDSFEAVFDRRVSELRGGGEFDQQEAQITNGKTLIITAKALSGGKILVSYVDISAIRDSERQMQETRRELERVGQFMRDAACAMTQGLLVVQDGTIVLSNEAAARILHVPLDMVAQDNLAVDIFEHCAARGDFGPDTDRLLTTWREIIAKRQPFSHGFLAAGKTWVHMEASFSGEGHCMFVLNDLTEMKQREEELTRLLARSEAADRAKSDFLANMSHEIRTPMNGVLGMAELLARTQLDTRQRTFVDIIGKSGNALLTIINDILDFSKIDAGQMKLKKAPFDPVEAIEDVVTLLSSAAAEKDLELLVRCGAEMPPVVIGDAGRFRQIVTNLVGNAVKFTETGHVLVELTAKPDDDGMIMLGLKVEDTGIGIAPEKRETIFEKFSQGDTSSTRRHDGTGLGLAITSRLVDLFGGYITVESEPGAGSVFCVQLPMAAPARKTDERELPVNVKGARVIVVDGNPVSRGILEEQLQRWGFDAYGTGSGEEALAMLASASELGVKVDAMVLDYQMPDMNGGEIARIIRENEDHDHLAIIFLTSMDAVGDDNFFTAMKVQAHLMKPARAKVLRNAIVDAVRASRIRKLRAAPAVETDMRRASSVAPVREAAAEEERSGYDVLVAEDNEVNCIVFSQILQGLGLRFLLVNDGRQAVEAWKKYRPGIVLMDVSMPVMNGHHATMAIREAEAEEGVTTGGTPIVGVTAHAHDVDRDLCFRSGMNDYISKPLSPEMLEEKIHHWLPHLAKSAGNREAT